MKWHHPLTETESARLYAELADRGAFCTGHSFPWGYESLNEEGLLTLALLQCRYDPRLLAILTDYLSQPHPDLHPVRLKAMLRDHGALPIAAVLGEFIENLSDSDEAKDLMQFLCLGAQPVPYQLFYRGLYPVAGSKMEDAATRPLWAFKKWGFLATDAPLLKETMGSHHPYLYDAQTRQQILRTMAAQKKTFRLKDYLEAIQYSVSRQQALTDLHNMPEITRQGQGRGMLYKITVGAPGT
jgi:hypothetical protein